MDITLLKNRFAELFYKEKIITGYVKEVKGKRFHTILPSGKEELINHGSFLYFEEKPQNFKDINQVIFKLREKNEVREKLKDLFNLKDLWEVVSGEKEEFLAKDLVELYLGKEPSEDEIAGFIRKVCEEKNYFKIKEPNVILVMDRDIVQKILYQREKELEKLKKLVEGERIIRMLVEQRGSDIPDEEKDFWISALKEYVIWEEQTPNGKLVSEILEKLEMKDPLKVFNLLISLKIFEEDENLDLIKSGFPCEFKKEELEEAFLIEKMLPDQNLRIDLTYLNTFTVDAEETEDFDDALSFEEDNLGYTIYIHIAEVAGFIKPFSFLWEGALERGSTLYLPDKIFPMLPFSLSHKKFSLRKGEPKPALTFKIKLQKNYEITDFEIFLSLIEVKNRLTYNQVDKFIEQKIPFWERLYKIFLHFKEKREEKGAFAVILPQVEVKVTKNGEIKVFKIEMTPARNLIAEAMILTNYLGAKFLIQNKIPAIFRSQPKPLEIIENIEESLFLKLLQLKFLARSEISLTPEPHSGLGLECYTTLTSPIRRFVDLVNQYQIKAFLTNNEPLSEEILRKILPEIQNNLQRANFLQTKREKYFLLKYLQNYVKDEPLKGIVINVFNKKAKVYLVDYNLTGELPGAKTDLNPGDEILVKIDKVNPRAEILRLKPC